MSDVTIRSHFEFDEHSHLFVDASGTDIAKVKFSQLIDGRDNAVNGFAAVKYVFGAEDDPDPIMEYQRVNLTNKTSANGWNKVAGILQSHDPRDWETLVQRAISLSLREWYEASSKHAPMTTDFDIADVDAPFLIEPLVSSTGLTMLFSPPGSGKSMVALGIAASLITGHPILGATPIKTGNVIYVDFEDSKSTHDIRLKAILSSIEWDEEPKHVIEHYKVNGSLRQHLSRIRSLARDLDAALIIVDSMGRARGTDPSDGDATIKLTDAMDTFGYPVLALDHVTKAVNEQIEKGTLTDPSAVTGIGSMFSTASARLGWFLRKMNTSTPMERKYNLHNNKYNHVAEQAPRSMTISLSNNAKGVLTEVKYKMWHHVEFTELVVEDARVTIARWMIREGITSTDATTASKATSLKRSSVAETLRSGNWFEKMPKQGKTQPYKLTSEGRDGMARLDGAQSDETQ